MKGWSITTMIAAALVSSAAFSLHLKPLQVLPHATGNDVSWPNCQKSKAVTGSFGIVGVNHGKVYTGNPCLRQEAEWFPSSTLALYANTANWGLPRGQHYTNFPHHCSANDEPCISYDFGYSAGKYAVMHASAQGVHAGQWWLDVETANYWTSDVLANREALQGTADAIRHYTIWGEIGFYSTSHQWNEIVGDWRPHDPAWYASGSDNAAEAAALCQRPSFTAGKIVMVQYTKTLDLNRSCS